MPSTQLVRYLIWQTNWNNLRHS